MREWLRVLNEGIRRAGQEMAGQAIHMGAHGSHELAATLFNGSAFVMYGCGHHDDPQKEQPQIEREM